jgi:hypothetical protein
MCDTTGRRQELSTTSQEKKNLDQLKSKDNPLESKLLLK